MCRSKYAVEFLPVKKLDRGYLLLNKLEEEELKCRKSVAVVGNGTSFTLGCQIEPLRLSEFAYLYRK